MVVLNNIIIRYSEIALKGKNRNFFEKRLINNIKSCLNKNKINYKKIYRVRGRIIIQTNHMSESCRSLKNIFGIASLSPALETNDYNLTKKFYKKGTFRISTKRLDKLYPLTSQQMNEKVGNYIVKETGAKVDLEKPQTNIGIEIINNCLYIFTKTIKGPGGLPVGVEGAVKCNIKNKNDVLACLLMMKRGCGLNLNRIPNELKKYGYGTTFKDRNSIATVTGETLKNISNKRCLRPLIGK